MMALLQQLLPDIAGHQGVAVLVHTMAKVLARHTNAGTPAVAQLPLVHIAPLVHSPSSAVHMY